ncbi:MAG: hypothetical protein VX699_13420 [Myxococcota bacterium]|nr:hypothetical protein [Myxococcota bacterium]
MSTTATQTVTEEMNDSERQVDIQAALEELEASLMYSVNQLTPSLDAIGEQLTRAAGDIRAQGDAGILWTCLDNLQHFLKLLETITVTAGVPPEDVAVFDDALSSSLVGLEERMNEAQNGEDIAVAIEETLLPALTTWAQCEVAIRKIIEPQSAD